MQSEDFSEMPIVASCKIAETGIIIMKVHVDNGSSVDIVYEQCFDQLPESIRVTLQPTTASLTGFAGESSWPIGVLPLDVDLVDDNDDSLVSQAWLDFYVMRTSSCYNMLLGRTALGKFGIVSSTIHGMIKFATRKGVVTINSTSKVPICAAINVKCAVQEAAEVTESMVLVNPAYPEQKIKLLVQYMDVFAWCENDMTGVPRHIAEHQLNVNPALKHVVQKRRGMAPDRVKWLCEEVTKLVRAGILREAQYQSWIVNPVLVKKPDGSWRMGYHQIPMAQEDIDKTAFHTGKGKFLGYLVTEQGIQANLKKIAVIENMTAPRTVKEVQSLTGKLAALTRFLSKAAERQLPFFKSLKGWLKQKSFVWSSKAEAAFQEMKNLLKTLPTLTAPIDGKILYLYISVENEAFGSVLIAERDKIQNPVYFVSKALT
ncbi:uncharacterized protein [Rutidosis leptorrhynchoides]|uniref:uncharacterized protein n=1 Tax=Rutidosis leptorrhynchoides TaxID=125765 RepID=UPI003A99189C